MLIPFVKMHGFGNDFIVFDFREENKERSLTKNDIIFLSDRNYGIGADQILVIYKSDVADDEKGVNVNLKIYNQDGSEAQQCGNGIRCITGYISLNSDKPLVRVSINGSKLIPGKADKTTSFAKVNMGVPVVNGDMVDIGNKHKVVIVNNFDNIDQKPNNEFNVNYVQITSRDDIFVKTIERGVGETLSCGSGVCASVAYCIANNLTNKVVKVLTKGSDIMDSKYEVSWDGVGAQMLQNGGYTFVYNGNIELVG